MGKQVWEIEKYKKWRFESNIRKTFNMELIDGKKLFDYSGSVCSKRFECANSPKYLKTCQHHLSGIAPSNFHSKQGIRGWPELTSLQNSLWTTIKLLFASNNLTVLEQLLALLVKREKKAQSSMWDPTPARPLTSSWNWKYWVSGTTE